MSEKKPVTFSLKGEPFNPVAIKPTAESVKRYLDKLPFGSLATNAEVAQALNINSETAGKAAHQLKPYCVVRVNGANKQIIWGSRRTIAELIRQSEL